MKLGLFVVATVLLVSCASDEETTTLTDEQNKCIEDYLAVSSEEDAIYTDAYDSCVDSRETVASQAD